MNRTLADASSAPTSMDSTNGQILRIMALNRLQVGGTHEVLGGTHGVPIGSCFVTAKGRVFSGQVTPLRLRRPWQLHCARWTSSMCSRATRAPKWRSRSWPISPELSSSSLGRNGEKESPLVHSYVDLPRLPKSSEGVLMAAFGALVWCIGLMCCFII